MNILWVLIVNCLKLSYKDKKNFVCLVDCISKYRYGGLYMLCF